MQTDEHTDLPGMEYLVMQMAQVNGIKTVPYALLRLHPQDILPSVLTVRITKGSLWKTSVSLTAD